jgi:hypothetical protein
MIANSVDFVDFTQDFTQDFTRPKKYAFAIGVIGGRDTDVSPFKNAQVLLIDKNMWYAIGPNKRWAGLIESLEIQDVNCPIVFTTKNIAKNTWEHLLKSFITVEGIRDLDLFLGQLERIGGIVIYPYSDPGQEI